MTYEDIMDVVEDLVRIKSKKFAKGFLAQDDIAQEIRIKCFQSIGEFNSEKGQSVKTFLNVCTENHLRNLMRDKFAKFDPPCKNKGCFHFDPMGKPTKEAYSCEDFVKYMEKYTRKCNARMPCSMGDNWHIATEQLQDEELFESYDLNMSIKDALRMEFPENSDIMISLYEDLISGKKILKSAKVKIQKTVDKLIGN